MTTQVPESVRRRVAETARYRCGFCLMPQQLVAVTLHIEHIRPISRGGTNDENNLWLACPLCNLHKGVQTTAVDPETGAEVEIFSPRTQVWREHFAFAESNTVIVGITSTGRATASALRLNLPAHQEARRWWAEMGVYPPRD